MDRRRLPLTALRACEAAARHASFSKAADELSVTHAAISHQIKLLEALLGVVLFRRSNRGVRLTEAGEALVPALERARVESEAGGALRPRGNRVHAIAPPDGA